MRHILKCCVFLALFLCYPAAVLHSQSSSGDVLGTVVDASGAAISGVTLTLTNVDTGVSVTTTAKDGAYRFGQVLPGRYKIEAISSGFRTTNITDIQVNLDSHITQDITLPAGSTSEVIEVSGDAPQVDTVSNSVGGVVTQDSIDKLPVNTRQYLNLALLVPGTTQDGSRSFYNNVQIGGGSGYYTNGFVVDGVSNIFAEMGEPRQNFPPGRRAGVQGQHLAVSRPVWSVDGRDDLGRHKERHQSVSW